MIITITGASGFIGQNLTAYLVERRYQVEELSLRNSNWKERIVANSTALIHLAGKAHDTSHTAESDAYFKINRDLTIAVFHEFLKSDIRDFFFFSSVKAVADTVETILTEDQEKTPLTPYGKSKAEAEDYLLSQELPSGKRLFIIRPCMIHGPGNKGNLNLLYKMVDKGIPWPLAAFNNERSFLSVDNLCYLMQKLLEDEDVPSGIYNFADDKPVPTNELIRIIATASQRKPRLIAVPKSIMKLLAGCGGVFRLPLNRERLEKLTENYVVSNKKIKSVLRVKNLPLTAEQGLIKTIKSFHSSL